MNALIGFIGSDWWKLLRLVNYQIDHRYFKRFLQVSLFSLLNSRFHKKEKALYYSDLNSVKIIQPIFVLGHWRSGTTLLHELFSLDEQYAFPNLFEVSNPHTFLSREPLFEKAAANIPPNKRPMDNMEVTFRAPGEDEPALAVLSMLSPAIAWMFPRYEDFFDQYLTFEGISGDDIHKWQQAIRLFMTKLTFRYKKPLVMKSPANTARIKLILDIFPDARFIHIHRNPFVVFQSTVKLYKTAVAGAYLHQPEEGSINVGILKRYELMYSAYFEQRNLIPVGQFVEVQFEEFENDIVGQMRKIYSELDLDGYNQVEPIFQNYVDQHRNYKKNEHPPIQEPLRSEIFNRWQQSFDEWQYLS